MRRQGENRSDRAVDEDARARGLCRRLARGQDCHGAPIEMRRPCPLPLSRATLSCIVRVQEAAKALERRREALKHGDNRAQVRIVAPASAFECIGQLSCGCKRHGGAHRPREHQRGRRCEAGERARGTDAAAAQEARLLALLEPFLDADGWVDAAKASACAEFVEYLRTAAESTIVLGASGSGLAWKELQLLATSWLIDPEAELRRAKPAPFPGIAPFRQREQRTHVDGHVMRRHSCTRRHGRRGRIGSGRRLAVHTAGLNARWLSQRSHPPRCEK